MLQANKHLSAIEDFLHERDRDRTKLRLAIEDDSPFLLKLRLDPSRNQNISMTNSDLDAQVEWMKSYSSRYAVGREAYFIIEVDGQPVGSVRLYDYLPDRDSFCWGSWIIQPGAHPLTAYRSAILVYDLAFGPLEFTRSHFNVRNANTSVWKFHEKMGAKLLMVTGNERHYEYLATDYQFARNRFSRYETRKDS